MMVNDSSDEEFKISHSPTRKTRLSHRRSKKRPSKRRAGIKLGNDATPDSAQHVLVDIPCYELESLRQNAAGRLEIPCQPTDNNCLTADSSKECQNQNGHGTWSSYECNNGEKLVADVSAEAVKAHAKELGMDIDADVEYLWLAEEALLSELEYPWVELFDETTKKTYYYNEQTSESRWDNPVDAHFHDMYSQLKHEKFVSQPIVASLSKRESRLRRELERERAHYKEKKAEWSTREAKLVRQARKRESSLKSERDEWRAKVQALEQKEDTKMSNNDKEENVFRFERQMANLKVQMAEMSSDHAQVCQEYERQINKLNQENASRQAEIASLRQQYTATIQDYERREMAQKDNLKQGEKALTQVNEQLVELKANLTFLESQKEEQQQQQKPETDFEEHVAQLESKHALAAKAYEKRIATLHGQLAAHSDGRAITVTEYERQIGALQKELVELSARSSDGRAMTVKEYERRIAEVEKSAANSASALEAAAAREKTLLANLEKVTTAAESRVQACNTAKVLATKLEQALGQARLETELAHEQVEDLKAENVTLLAKIQSGEAASGDTSRAAASPAVDRTYHKRCQKLERALTLLRKEFSAEKHRMQVLREELEAAHATETELNTKLLEQEAALEASKRETYFIRMERVYLEEELITRKLSCKCASSIELEEEATLRPDSDTENDRAMPRSKRENRLRRANQRLAKQNTQLEEKRKRTNRHAAHILKSIVQPGKM